MESSIKEIQYHCQHSRRSEISHLSLCGGCWEGECGIAGNRKSLEIQAAERVAHQRLPKHSPISCALSYGAIVMAIGFMAVRFQASVTDSHTRLPVLSLVLRSLFSETKAGKCITVLQLKPSEAKLNDGHKS